MSAIAILLRRSLPLSRLTQRQNCRGFSIANAEDDKVESPADTASVSSDAQQGHRLAIFNEEFERQLKRAKRTVDKIEVVYTGLDGQSHSLYMNKGVSTPLDVAKHLSEELCSESVLARANNTTILDMHRPLNQNCSLKFLNFKTPSSKEEADGIKICNEALWRSGSLLLGSVFETAFNEAHVVKLISFPRPFIKSGSFVYDCRVSRTNGQPLTWNPSQSELRALSLSAERIIAADDPFQPMDVPQSVAMEIFKHNDVKLAAIQSIVDAKPNDKTVSVYRVGDFVDLSSGPMISRTGLIGRFEFAAVHQIDSPDFGQLMRVQGFAVPRAFLLHFSSVDLLRKRAAILNRSFMPTRPGSRQAVSQSGDKSEPAAAKSAEN